MVLNIYNNKVQSNLVNTDTEGAIESVHVHRVSTLSGLNLEKKCKGIFPRGQSKLCVNMWCPYQAGVPKAGLDCSHNAAV